MIGIYVWTNKINGMQYVGQSIDIERRKNAHIYAASTDNDAPLYKAMRQYGIDNFVFSVLEECTADELNERETFWITKLDTYKHGYNCNLGGDQYSIGECNPRTQLTNIEVLNIRNRIHVNGEDIKKVYEEYQDRISYSRFWSLVRGETWQNVDCSMIKNLPINNRGQRNARAKLKDDDVIEIRRRKYINHERTIDIFQDYKDRISFSAFEKIALGSTWIHIPIPKDN